MSASGEPDREISTWLIVVIAMGSVLSGLGLTLFLADQSSLREYVPDVPHLMGFATALAVSALFGAVILGIHRWFSGP